MVSYGGDDATETYARPCVMTLYWDCFLGVLGMSFLEQKKDCQSHKQRFLSLSAILHAFQATVFVVDLASLRAAPHPPSPGVLSPEGLLRQQPFGYPIAFDPILEYSPK